MKDIYKASLQRCIRADLIRAKNSSRRQTSVEGNSQDASRLDRRLKHMMMMMNLILELYWSGEKLLVRFQA